MFVPMLICIPQEMVQTTAEKNNKKICYVLIHNQMCPKSICKIKRPAEPFTADKNSSVGPF